jgi:hypothetical protein
VTPGWHAAASTTGRPPVTSHHYLTHPRAIGVSPEPHPPLLEKAH